MGFFRLVALYGNALEMDALTLICGLIATRLAINTRLIYDFVDRGNMYRST